MGDSEPIDRWDKARRFRRSPTFYLGFLLECIVAFLSDRDFWCNQKCRLVKVTVRVEDR